MASTSLCQRAENAGRGLGLLLVLGATLPACATTGHFQDAVYRRGDVGFRVGALPAGWKQVAIRGGDVVFRHRDGGTISASAQCPSSDDAPLDVLVNHLLFDIVRKQEAPRLAFTLDGRAALRSRLTGELDGVSVELDLVVMQKDGCAYDLQLCAGPQTFAARQPDFEHFLRGFTTNLAGQEH